MTQSDRHAQPAETKSNRHMSEPRAADAAGGGAAESPAVTACADGSVALDCERLADALLPAVLAAGRVEMTRWDDAEITVRLKSDETPVTEADHEAEEVLVAALASVAPGVLVIGEETFESSRPPRDGEPFFLVDPLDGTRDFIDHIPEFTVNVALIEHGRPVFGMIYAPALNALFVTTARDCARMALIECHTTTTSLKACRSRPIQTRASDPDNLIAFSSRKYNDAETCEILKTMGTCAATPVGSSLKFCLIARGYGDVYVRRGPTSEWDTAAGEAILEAAGGEVTTFDGGKIVYGGAERHYRNPYFVAWGDPRLRERATLW